MNLIEQLGGYDEARKCAAVLSEKLTEKQKNNVVFMDAFNALNDELLEHRRQHNIFEVGDLIVLMHTNYRSDVFALTKSFKEIYDEKGIVYRHATDAEIKAGKRLEVK